MAGGFTAYPTSCCHAHHLVAPASGRQEGRERGRRDGSGRSNSEVTRAEAAARERKLDFPPLPYGGPRGQVQPTKISLFFDNSKANTKPYAPNVGACIGESCYDDGTAVIEKGQHLGEELEMQRPDGGLGGPPRPCRHAANKNGCIACSSATLWISELKFGTSITLTPFGSSRRKASMRKPSPRPTIS